MKEEYENVGKKDKNYSVFLLNNMIFKKILT